MRLLYDHQIFSSFPRSGISRYYCELFHEFDALGEKWECSCRFSNNLFLKELRDVPSFLPGREFRGKNRILEWLNRLSTIKLLRQGEFDLFHSTYSKPYDKSLLGGRPYVITVHDMTHEHFPELPSAKREAAEEACSIARADGIICPSFAAAADLAELYPEAASKVTVIYHGVRLAEPTPEFHAPRPYLLHVGTRQFYRDFPTAVRAAAQSPELDLLCVGGGAFTAEETALFQECGMADRVRQANLSEPELARAYMEAAALLFPSRAEGFGLPVIEAAARGCVPILSDIPVFREIGGKGALYFPAGDADACAGCIRELLTDPALRDSLREAGAAGLCRFDWTGSARKHLELYDRLIRRARAGKN